MYYIVKKKKKFDKKTGRTVHLRRGLILIWKKNFKKFFDLIALIDY